MRRAIVSAMLVGAICFARHQTTAVLHQSQYEPGTITTGKLLVAQEDLQDPNFAKAVVLIVNADPDEGVLGVIVNRRSDVPLSKIFPRVKGASDDPVYAGGPVETGSGQALLRSDAKADGRHIVDDVYASGSAELIENSVAAKTSPAKFRLYLGYAGWAPGQLEAEIAAGAWLVRPATASVVFDADPDSLWTRLIRESRMRIADAREPAARSLLKIGR